MLQAGQQRHTVQDQPQKDPETSDILEYEVVEQKVSLGQEDLGKLRKFLLVDQIIFRDVEDILERMQQPWLHSLQTSSSFLQISTSFLHSHKFLLGQLLWLLCCLVLSLVVGAPWLRRGAESGLQ